ncbi:MAG: MmgE/PrpD family protein [Bradymonadaceae bacterium]
MPIVHELAEFAHDASFDELDEAALDQLKIRVLDGIGGALGALGADPVRRVRDHVDALGGADLASLIGGGSTAPDRAALYNGFLVRYLDYNDSYLAEGETCHPSDNIAPVLAAAQVAEADGREFLTALAVAYQVHCRLSDEAPVRDRGFDHTTQGSYAAAAGAARALGLDVEKTAHAIAISGTALNALRVTRTGALSNWKGLAYPHTAFGATHATWLAKHGITGPPEVFEGNKGFMHTIAGSFELDWDDETLDRVPSTIVKKYNAEIHSQSALEGIIELRNEHRIDPERVEAIELQTFDVAYDIIGGGEEGDKTRVRTKEEADHSLPYMLAVALLDGQVLPEQYEQTRIESDDVQRLLQRVEVTEKSEYSRRFPDEMPCRVRVEMADGTSWAIEKDDYEGFHSRPMSWESVTEKFRWLTDRRLDRRGRRRLGVDSGRGVGGVAAGVRTDHARRVTSHELRVTIPESRPGVAVPYSVDDPYLARE